MSVITPAASVLLTRGPGSRDLFAILRGQHLKFFGGFWAFPGGKLSAEDTEATDHLEARRTAACRELFEETGVLVARRSDGEFSPTSPDLDACRHALLAEQIPFASILAERGLTVRAEDFALIGEITTPDFAPLRYATTFFVAHLPPGQHPVVWPGELERGEWIDGQHLLAKWRSSEILLTPPTVMSLETLGEQPIDLAPQRLGPLFGHLSRGAIHPIFFAPFVRMLPLKTAGLPPSTHTNAYIVGNSPRYLIDPGAEDTSVQKCLLDFLKSETPLTAIVLTHHHPDHVGAAAVCANRFRLPIWAHAQTAKRLECRIKVERMLNDGDRLDLGPCPGERDRSWFLEVLHTPGHASGHLTFYEPYYRLLFAGDMISTLSSMVIAPPDGNLAEYLQSLIRLRERPARLLLPSHGNVSARPVELIDAALAHRAKREMQLLDSLTDEPAAVEELTERLYRGTPEPLMRFARAQVLAGLLKLQAEGRACPLDADRWQRS